MSDSNQEKKQLQPRSGTLPLLWKRAEVIPQSLRDARSDDALPLRISRTAARGQEQNGFRLRRTVRYRTQGPCMQQEAFDELVAVTELPLRAKLVPWPKEKRNRENTNVAAMGLE
jgi:hypothetical protein